MLLDTARRVTGRFSASRSGAVALALVGAGALWAARSTRRTPASPAEAALAAAAPLLSSVEGAAGLVLLAAGRRRAALWALVAAGAAAAGRAPCRRAPSPRARRGGHPLRVLSANVRWESAEVDALGAEIGRAGTDLVVLQELTHGHRWRLEASGALRGYPWASVWPQADHRGVGLWARHPLVDPELLVVGGEPCLRASLVLPGGGTVRVYGVHPPAPVPGKFPRWAGALAELAELVRADRDARSLPVVVAGDFNATRDHLPFRAMLGLGLVDAATTGRRVRRMTWPGHLPLVPALVELDHVLVSGDVAVLRHRVVRRRVSDHRPVVVDLVCPIVAPARRGAGDEAPCPPVPR